MQINTVSMKFLRRLKFYSAAADAKHNVFLNQRTYSAAYYILRLNNAHLCRNVVLACCNV